MVTRVLLAIVICLWATAAMADEPVIIIKKQPAGNQIVFINKHSDEFVWDVIEELTGSRPAEDADRGELASLALGILNDRLPVYGQKETAQVRPEIPYWVLDGYEALNPGSVSKSRYLNAVLDGTLEADMNLGALYTFWCVYDAEWFSLSRHADHKAWLSAVMLTYPPIWTSLQEFDEDQLHHELVAPLQTPDEPYREIDNWIKRLVASDGAFAKPNVRSALVNELLDRAGMESDGRFTEEMAYSLPAPMHLGVTEREFFLIAALSLEFFSEIYQLDPETRQPWHIRDYFVAALYDDLKK